MAMRKGRMASAAGAAADAFAVAAAGKRTPAAAAAAPARSRAQRESMGTRLASRVEPLLGWEFVAMIVRLT
jgi:hypothetical protein